MSAFPAQPDTLTSAWLAVFLLALLLSGLLVPYVIKLAVRLDAIDKPTTVRKMHRHDMPLWGGLAVWAAFFLTVGFLWLSGSPLLTDGLGDSFSGIFWGGTFIVLVGVIDDKKGLPPKLKLIGQLLAGLILVLSGVRMHGLQLPVFGYLSLSPFWGGLGAIFWVALLVNAFNFIDGLDGLSGGIGLIVALTLSLIALKISGPILVVVCGLALAGAILGFLFYNFNPARIFLGDTGSHFIGFTLAAITLVGTMKGAAALTVVIPMLALAIPLLDTFAAVVRRSRRGLPISKADKSHLHHVMLRTGLSPRQAVLVLYLFSVVLGGLAWLLAQPR